MGEKVEATKWVLWGIAIMLLLTAIGYVLKPVNMRVEREVLVPEEVFVFASQEEWGAGILSGLQEQEDYYRDNPAN